MGSGADMREFNPWEGQYGWQLYYVFGIEGTILINFLVFMFVKNKLWLIASGVVCTIGLVIMTVFYVRQMITIRDFVGGIDWIEATIIKDVDYIQEDRLGVKDYSLLTYKLYGEEDTDSIEGIENLFVGIDYDDDETVEYLMDYFARKERVDVGLKGNEKIKFDDKEREAKLKETAKRIDQWVMSNNRSDEDAKNLVKYLRDTGDHHHTSEKERELDRDTRNIPLDQQFGEYVYILKLVSPYWFFDSVDHKYDHIILITNLPYGNQFKYSQETIYQNGWWVNAKTTRATFDVESWVDDDRPVMRVEWSLSESLDIKRKKVNQEPNPVHRRMIDILRSMVKNLRSKFERADIKMNQLEEEGEYWHKLYSWALQEKEYQRDEWLGSATEDSKVMKMRRGVFLAIVIPLSVAFLGCLIALLVVVL